MAQVAGIEIEGFREMGRMLDQLPDKVAKRLALNALRSAARPVLKAAERMAPVGREDASLRPLRTTGRIRRGKRLRLPTVFVEFTAPHSILVEFGTGQRFHRGGRATGRMPAKPFLRPAFDQTRTAQLRAMRKNLARGIEREAAKLAGRGKRR